MWKEKQHKDKGKLIKISTKHSGLNAHLPWKEDDLWLFMGSATDPNGQEWWLFHPTFITNNLGMRIDKQKNQGWKQALGKSGYSVVVIQEVK